jgi:hypothetical protein
MNGRGQISRRELLLVALSACLLAVVMHWPLVLNLGDQIPKDLGDPLPQSWQVAWGGHALANQPLEFFQANQFWPTQDSLAFGDALIGYAPAGLIGEGPHDAVVRYDLLFLLAYALAFLGAYLLARELGIAPPGAAVAGAAFAFAPFRLEQDGHMQVISSGGIPLCLAFFVRGARLRRPLWLVAGWLVAGWQLSLGFALGLPLAYLLAAGVVAIVAVWLWRGRPPIDRRLVVAGVGGAVIFIAIAALIARPYFRVADEHPEAKRPPATVEAFSGPVSVFLTAPDENLVWGEATAEIREGLENVPEKALFPGMVILLLALVGLSSARLDRRLRIGLGASVVAISVLALGFREDDGLLWPYRVLYEVLPGWDAIRTPGRLVTFSSLALALLAGAGAEWALRGVRLWLAGRRLDVGPRGSSAFAYALATVAVAAVVVEGRGLPFDPNDDQAQPAVPDPPASTAEVPAPQLHLPAEGPEDNRRYLLWSTDGFPEIVNGRASTEPDLVSDVIAEMDGFPDRPSVERLRELGVRSVVLHTERAAGTPQADAAAAPIAGLGLVRRRLPGGLLVYGVRSPSAGSASGASAPPAAALAATPD